MDRRKRAEAIVQRSVYWSAAVGVVPLPLIDVAALTLLNVKMIQKLAELYEQPFEKSSLEAQIAALLGGVGAAEIKLLLLKAGICMVPVVGPLLGAAAMPASSASLTYAIGHLFINQLESSGGLRELDSSRVITAAVVHEDPPAEERPALSAPAPAEEERPADPPAPAKPPPDDLTIVNGIGPKIAALLTEHGIPTLSALAQTPVETLREILQEAGPRFAYHDPSSWPEQARLAAEGELDLLLSMQSSIPRA